MYGNNCKKRSIDKIRLKNEDFNVRCAYIYVTYFTPHDLFYLVYVSEQTENRKNRAKNTNSNIYTGRKK